LKTAYDVTHEKKNVTSAFWAVRLTGC